ncbi:hypothetical protein ZWY2020_028315 [Hordeum vulgare]|nr:hypothetical protein ZWY2020_028315 [Hordeum vulgare]
MARVEAVVVCLLIVAMDAAGVLGSTRRKLRARQPVPQAYKLGVAAAAVLAASHAIANIVGGCYCTWPCCSCGQARRSSPNRQMASFALVLTWMVLLVGLALLILGALPNSKKSMAECGLVRHRFLHRRYPLLRARRLLPRLLRLRQRRRAGGRPWVWVRSPACIPDGSLRPVAMHQPLLQTACCRYTVQENSSAARLGVIVLCVCM